MPLCGNAYKISVTGLAFCVIWHSKHSADWLAALASPYPASPDFPRKRGQNKTPRNTLFISISTVSTGYSAPACGGKVVAPATKGGLHFRRPQGGCIVLIYDGAEGAVPLQWNGTSYLPRAEPSTRPEGVSRSRTEPLAPRARGPAAPSTLAAKPRQPSGILGKHRPGPGPDRAASAPISSVPQRSRGADRYTLQ